MSQDTTSDLTSPLSSVHAASPEGASTMQSKAQKRIQKLLKAEKQLSFGEALQALRVLEKHQFSALSADDLDPTYTTGLCCFDLGNTPSRWTAHIICQRCRAIYALLSDAPDCISKAVVGAALITTDCESSSCLIESSSMSRGLPLELNLLIIDAAVEAFKETKDGSVLCKLMHVSCLVRSRVCRAFEPVRVYECDTEPRPNTIKVNLPRTVSRWIGDSLEWAFADFSYKKFRQPPVFPDPCEEIISTRGLVPWQARVAVELTCDLDCTDEKEVKRVSWSDHWVPKDEKDGRRFFELIRDCTWNDGFYQSTPIATQEQDVESAAPRFLNIFERALRGNLDASSQGVVIVITAVMYFVNLDGPEGQRDELWHKRWRYDTLKTRPPTYAALIAAAVAALPVIAA